MTRNTVVEDRKWSIVEFDELFESVKNWGVWGLEDAKGTLNYIQADHVRRAASLVRSGRSISLSLPVNKRAGPDNPNPAIHYMASGHDTDIGSGSLRFATDFLGMQFHGNCHTHIDALCHIAYRGQLFNGRPAELVTTTGADAFDVTEYAQGVVGRGVLLDIPDFAECRGLNRARRSPAMNSKLQSARRESGLKREICSSFGRGSIAADSNLAHGITGPTERVEPGFTWKQSPCCTKGGLPAFFLMETAKQCRARLRGSRIRSTRCRSLRWECSLRTVSTLRTSAKPVRPRNAGNSWLFWRRFGSRERPDRRSIRSLCCNRSVHVHETATRRHRPSNFAMRS